MNNLSTLLVLLWGGATCQCVSSHSIPLVNDQDTFTRGPFMEGGADYYPQTRFANGGGGGLSWANPLGGPGRSNFGPMLYNQPFEYGYYDNQVQGNSRRTWSTGGYNGQDTLVQMDSQGRPIHATLSVWEGPNYTPLQVSMYSEDGNRRPFQTLVEGGMHPHSVTVHNDGPLEFPFRANVQPAGFGGGAGPAVPPSDVRRMTIDGNGSLKTMTLPPHTHQVKLTLTSQGGPIQAKVELWQGPGQARQVALVNSQDGRNKPFSAMIDTHGGTTLAVRNTGPMEFPIEAFFECYSGNPYAGAGGHMYGGYQYGYSPYGGYY